MKLRRPEARARLDILILPDVFIEIKLNAIQLHLYCNVIYYTVSAHVFVYKKLKETFISLCSYYEHLIGIAFFRLADLHQKKIRSFRMEANKSQPGLSLASLACVNGVNAIFPFGLLS